MASSFASTTQPKIIVILNKYPPTSLSGGIPKGKNPKTKEVMEKGYWKYTEPELITGEYWRDIKGFDAYQVSNYGRIRTRDYVQMSSNRKAYRICSGQIVQQHKTNKGYLKVLLYGKDGRQNLYVHRIVAMAFVKGCASGLVVNHLNEIKTDNRAINLEWCTPKENTNYGTARQRQREAMINNPKLSKPVELLCKVTGQWITTFPSQREAARQLNCPLSTIQRCINHQKRTYKGFILIPQQDNHPQNFKRI